MDGIPILRTYFIQYVFKMLNGSSVSIIKQLINDIGLSFYLD